MPSTHCAICYVLRGTGSGIGCYGKRVRCYGMHAVLTREMPLPGVGYEVPYARGQSAMGLRVVPQRVLRSYVASVLRPVMLCVVFLLMRSVCTGMLVQEELCVVFVLIYGTLIQEELRVAKGDLKKLSGEVAVNELTGQVRNQRRIPANAV
eukprot:3232192-Rhodomonas_salina.1